MVKRVNNKRRNFLKLSGITATLIASENSIFARTEALLVENSKKRYPNANYTEEMYRNEFSFVYGKKEDHGFSDGYEIWSHNGVVTRENQVTNYPNRHEKIPDFNPSGSTIRSQYSQIMYQKDRILYPMIRTGERGEGRWKRASWNEAVEKIAQNIFDTLSDSELGPDKLMVYAGDGLNSEIRRSSVERFSSQLGAISYSSSDSESIFSGATVAYGKSNLGCNKDSMYRADTLVIWGANPLVSDMSNAHFILEGKYNGAKVIVITPEFNATAKSANIWIPVKTGSDNILAMSIINTILNQKLFKPDFMKIHTDLVFLVDIKTKKMLRRSDMEYSENIEDQDRYESQFYCYNGKTDAPTLMPGSHGSSNHTLKLEELDIEPILEGEWEITDINGIERRVTTVFEQLRVSSAEFTPEKTQYITGVHPDTVIQLAKDMAIPKVVEITVGSSLNRYFNGVMTVWNIASICGLTGHIGLNGGLNTKNDFRLLGSNDLFGFNGKYNSRLGSRFVSEFMNGDGMETFKEYFEDEDIKRAQNGMSKDEYINVIEELLLNGKHAKANNESNYGNVAKPWWLPTTAVVVADSIFHKNKGNEYRKAFLNHMDFFVYIDYRMSETAQYADVLLPSKSKYEVYDLGFSPDSNNIINFSEPIANIKSIGEAEDEWTIFTLLAKKLEEIASRPENITKAKIEDNTRYARSGFHDLTIFHKEYTNIDEDSKAYFGTDKMAVEAVLKKYLEDKEWSIDRGGKFLSLNKKEDSNLFEFKPLNTISGRQTFYVDHDIYIKMGATTNIGMENIRPQDKKYPYFMITSNSRFSTTSNSSRTLLRLQRGVPSVQLNRVIAVKKGIKDGDTIRVFNKLGEFYAMVKLSSSSPIDGLVMESGWESYMYKFNKSPMEVLPMSLNLLELADGWGHLKFSNSWNGNTYLYDATVNYEKVNL